jgi:transcriptional/translational regulatory protein YebC/TACO1
MEIALEAGAEDVKLADGFYEVICPVDAFTAVGAALDAAGVDVESSAVTRIPSNTAEVTDLDIARTVLQLIEAHDDHDDVQNVFANYNIPDEALAEIGPG